MNHLKLTSAEKEVLYLLTKEFYTQKKIALRRHCTKQAVSKIIKSLKKKGAYNISLQSTIESNPSSQPVNQKVNQIRIHAEHWVIRILYKDSKYNEIRKKCSQIEIDGNTIKLWENKIEIYANKSFFGNDLAEAFRNSCNYWNAQFTRLEHDLKSILTKQRSQNKKLVRIHIAETNNEISKEVDNEGERYFAVRANEDGRIWILVDNSFNLHELETLHPDTSKEDMEKVKSNLNDWREKESYLPSDTKAMIDKLAIVSSNMLQAQQQEFSVLQQVNVNSKWLNDNIRSHAPSWFGMTSSAKDMLKQVRILKGIVAQKKLGEWM